jgi:prolipoprotein diacylglyceryltransferase
MARVSALLASIPSPPTGVYKAGPLTIHMYGVMLLLAIAACICSFVIGSTKPLTIIADASASERPRDIR